METNPIEVSPKRRQSHWWVAYHVWAAWCLNQLASRSGVYSKLLPAPWLKSLRIGASPGSLDQLVNRITVVNVVVMLVVFGVGFLASQRFLIAIDRSKDSPRAKRVVKWILPVAYYIVAVIAPNWISPMVDAAVRSTPDVRAPVAGVAAKVYRLAAPSVALIQTYVALPRDSNGIITLERSEQPILQGSGVVIDNQHVLSNCHVLMPGGFWTVTIGGHEYTDGKLAATDPERDLCTLKIPNLSAPPVRLASNDAFIGQRVFTIGAPRGLDLTIGEGLISALRQDSGGTVLQTSAPISPGSSGGGLFDGNGELLGITAYQYVEGENLNFALPIRWIADLPDRSQKYRARRAQSVQYVLSCMAANRRQEYERARQIGETWSKSDPYNASAWQCLGEAATGQADFVTAFHSLNKAVELGPDPSALVALGAAHIYWDIRSLAGLNASSVRMRHEDEVAAETALKRAIAIDPQYGEAWERLSQLYDLTRQYNEAFASANRATEIDPTSAFAWERLASACLDLKKNDCAISAAKRATTLDGSDLDAWGVLRLAAQAVGDPHLESSAVRRIKVLARSIKMSAQQ